MKNTKQNVIIIGCIAVMVVAVVICAYMIIRTQEKIIEGQQAILDNLNSTQPTFINPVEVQKNRTPIGFKS